MALLVIDNQGGVFRTDITAGTTTRLADFDLIFTDIAVAPDGRVFANTFSTLYELDLLTGTAVARAALTNANALAFDADGHVYVAGLSSEIRVLSAATFELERTIALPSNTTSAGDIHINGNTLYLTTNARTILTMDLASGTIVDSAFHGITGLFGLHSESGRIFGLAGNDIFELNPDTGLATLRLELPFGITINGAATLAGVQVTGTARADLLLADANGSVLIGLEGDDILIGSAARDTLEGGAGRDHLHGLEGRDILIGGQDRDILEGGGGNDRLFGGSGRDILSGGRGNDTLSGGSGRDSFVFYAREGADVVTDFDGLLDVLEIEASLLGRGPKTLDRLFDEYATVTADGVLFDFGRSGSIHVENVSLADLQNSVLLF
jgi:Ca2+-binding RTX toxin-like protein